LIKLGFLRRLPGSILCSAYLLREKFYNIGIFSKFTFSILQLDHSIYENSFLCAPELSSLYQGKKILLQKSLRWTPRLGGMELFTAFIFFHILIPMGLQSKGRLVALPSNIRLRWKQLKLTNTLAYHDRKLIRALKCFIPQGPGVNLIKRI
jgi:hypothetical protein